jgi:hypothetical protein
MAEKKVIQAPPDDKWKMQASNLFNKMIGNIPDDSTAVDVAGVVADLNELLGVLRGLNTK